MNTIKSIVKTNKLLYKIAVIIITALNKSKFGIYKFMHLPIKYELSNGTMVKFFPNGQISFGVYLKSFEPMEAKLISKLVKPGSVVVDVGANIGFYSLLLKNIVGDSGKIYAFEPSKKNYENLLKNISLNKAINIKPYNIGLGDQSNQTLTLRQDVGYGDAEKYLFHDDILPIEKLDNVKSVKYNELIHLDTLDNIMSQNKINSIDFLKIDTEGYEHYVLQGAKNILENSKDILILMECTPLGTLRANTSQKKVYQFLKKYGLNPFYWNKQFETWADDWDGVLGAGDVWVCKDYSRLDLFNHNILNNNI